MNNATRQAAAIGAAIQQSADEILARPVILRLSERELALIVHAVDLRAAQLRSQADAGSRSAKPLHDEHAALSHRLNSVRLNQ